MSRFVKLMLAFGAIIILLSATFSGVAVLLVGNRVLDEARGRVKSDINAAEEMYAAYSTGLYDLIRLSADRFYLRDALLAGSVEPATGVLSDTMEAEDLDFLSVTDPAGTVLLRAGHPGALGDSQAGEPLIAAVLASGRPAVGNAVFAAERLDQEAPGLSQKARIDILETRGARPLEDEVLTSGLVLLAAAPIFDYSGDVIGALYGGLLLNYRVEIVDEIKATVFAGAKHRGVDVGTATLFLDDVRIATNVLNDDGTRAIGTRVSAQVYQQVVVEGRSWLDRAYVVRDWYLTAYVPLRDFGGRVVGMLYVGTLEQPYTDLKTRSTLLFVGITLGGVALATAISFLISRRMTTPVRALVKASRRVAEGDLDARVTVTTHDEIGELAGAFNTMAAALEAREEQLREFTRKRIMQSERLAVVGQLAADVAHELNNPLQGIVTYSHLLLERLPEDDPKRAPVEKIATQAARCATIIRALLDFSRPKKPHKKHTNLCAVVEECFSLVEDRAIFHNIEVVRDYADCLPDTVVDPSQMQQVFMNLIINAAEAMGGAGRLSVSAGFDPDAQVIRISFGDTGHGISEADLSRIFDPFFTTKEVGHGTGLGLAISFGIVKEHGGTISVESEPGVGTTFTIELPLGEEVPA
jgi:two-component system NtrC family sensor kinase